MIPVKVWIDETPFDSGNWMSSQSPRFANEYISKSWLIEQIDLLRDTSSDPIAQSFLSDLERIIAGEEGEG